MKPAALLFQEKKIRQSKMEKDGLNGRLSCVKNEMTHLWGTSFLMGGGAFSLMLTNHSFIGYFWGTIGIIAATVFFGHI